MANQHVHDLPFTQAVRIVDVVLLGPAMIYASFKAAEIPTWMRVFLAGAGAATMTWNGINLVRHAAGPRYRDRREKRRALPTRVRHRYA